WQQDYYPGMTLWGWMDAPSEVSYQFSTCNPDEGFQETEYTNDFHGGMQWEDTLNFPSLLISTGDWVASMDGAHEYGSADDVVEIGETFGDRHRSVRRREGTAVE
ncbi:MAG: hypothetical protein ACO3SP_11635, partial [Ilumatobacteraceae bacterium]